MTKLDELLENIDPAKTIEKIKKSADKAIITFKLDKASIENREEFEACLANFFCHVENVSLNINMPVNPKFHYHRCIQFFNEEYGPNGENIAFEMAQTGVDGGLYAVLRMIAGRLANNYAQNEIGVMVSEYLKNLTPNEWITAAEEYREKCGHLIPAEFRKGSAGLLAGHLRKILEEHPSMIQRMRRVGR